MEINGFKRTTPLKNYNVSKLVHGNGMEYVNMEFKEVEVSS